MKNDFQPVVGYSFNLRGDRGDNNPKGKATQP